MKNTEIRIIKNTCVCWGTPLISVIIPVYNGEKYIGECYKCLDNQTYKNLEIIFINDGSKDNTKNLLDDLATNDSRIVVIHKKNGGVSSARNAGLDIAKGDYISFYDVDDQLDNRFFEVLLNDAIYKDVDLVISMNAWIKENANDEKHFDEKFLNLSNQIFDSVNQFYVDYYSVSYKSAAGIYNAVWGKLFSKRILVGKKFNSQMKYFEDSLFMFEILSQNPKTYFDSYQGYTYILRKESAIGSLKNNYIKSCKHWADWARFYIENYKLCVLNCNENTIALANDNLRLSIHRVILSLIKNSEKIYYKQNKNLFKSFIKEMSLEGISFGKKIYLKLYLFSSSLCWSMSRCIAYLQKPKVNKK